MSELLHPMPENPLPKNAVAGHFTARGHITIRFARFAETAKPAKGTVVLLTGRNECIEKYFETIEDLQKLGFGVAISDWRGQGGSDRLTRDRLRGYVDSFDDYVADLDQFFDEVVLPDCKGPYYLLAHSAGALVALLAAPMLVNRVRRMVLSAPLIQLVNMPLSMTRVRQLTGLMRWTGLGRVYLAGKPGTTKPDFATNVVTSDAARFQRNSAIVENFPELALGGPTAGWLYAASRAAATVTDPEFMAKIRVPSLFIVAGADTVVSTRAAELYARRLRSGMVVTVDGARHEMLQERDFFREQALAAIEAFIPGSGAA
ncbi:alpha/beta fold hydrolase [Mesorhizobium sp. NBSH29]|uniref:alpha/beta fold hydrolase n=1 Tax=Mesorhizobium sp. NBSH29 TaxID=2654249 RepID=UPI0018964EA4|nr:alpha/beta hydrolase [Mesorhizobium sp. NBSH29]QPC88446.1 alpha/beta fold hydrolase [Mesorhizobium sp. NBSH29]